MMIEAIKQEVIELLSVLFKDRGFGIDNLEYVDLIQDFGMDSITFIAMVVELEAHFEIEVPDDMLLFENFKRIDDIVYVVKNELSKKSKVTETIDNAEK